MGDCLRPLLDLIRNDIDSFTNLEMEQDRIPGFWVVTAFPNPQGDVVLRTRINQHTTDYPCVFHCEIRHRGELEFKLVSTIEVLGIDSIVDDGYTDYRVHLADVPPDWRAEFWEMIRRWAICHWVLKYGSVSEIRYAWEPASSVDCLDDCSSGASH